MFGETTARVIFAFGTWFLIIFTGMASLVHPSLFSLVWAGFCGYLLYVKVFDK
mgnify:FL=1|tara:strand:+ start:841 stop:999 length:159 start_codon:yes stop_codon:yes gene_type:complete